MNIKDLENYEIEEVESKPLNLSDLEGYEVEDEPSTETKDLELTPQSTFGRADVKAAEQALESTGAGEAIERGITKAGEAVKSSPVAQKVGKGTEGLTKSVLSKVGPLESGDIDLVSEQSDRYKQIKDAPGELPKQTAILADELGETAQTATKNLDILMDADQAGMPREEFLEDVKSRVSDSRREPDVKRVEQAKKAEKELAKVEKNVAKQQTKYQSKLAELENKLNEVKTLQKEYKEAPDKLLEAKLMKDKEIQEMERRKDALLDEMDEYDDPKASKEIRKDIRKVNQQKRKLNENLKDLANEAKVEKSKNIDLAKKYEQQAKEIQDEIKSLKGQNKKDATTLKKMLDEAKAQAETYKLRGTGMAEETRKAYEGLERAVDYTTELTGKDLEVAKEYADRFYGKDGDEVRKAVRAIVREKSPKAAAALDQASASLQNRQNLLKMLGFSDMEIRNMGVTSSEAVIPKGEASSNLAKSFYTEEGAEGAGKTVKEKLIKVFEDAGRPDLINDMELNRIAKLAQGDATVVDAYLASKGFSPSAVKRIAQSFGAKIQEVGARGLGAAKKALDTPLGKAAGKVAKGAAKTLPFIAAGLDYAEAGDLGIESELGKVAYAGIEQLNPLPVSTGQMFQAMSEQAPMRAAATRRAAASNYGLQEDPKKEISIKSLQDPENIQSTITKLSGLGTDAGYRYANTLGMALRESNAAERDRRLASLATEPGFRKLMRKLGYEAPELEENRDVDGQEN